MLLVAASQTDQNGILIDERVAAQIVDGDRDRQLVSGQPTNVAVLLDITRTKSFVTIGNRLCGELESVLIEWRLELPGDRKIVPALDERATDTFGALQPQQQFAA
jgi:hypothetical protein